MTSKNCSFDPRMERKLALRLTREKMRHSLWALCLFALLLFFTMTLPTAVSIQQLMERRRFADWTQAELLEEGIEKISNFLGLGNGLTAIVVANMALVMAAVCFRYLHNKNQVDFYHSLPVRRPYLFAANFGAGVAGFLIAYFGNLLLSGLIAACSGFGSALVQPAVGAAVVMHCVFFLTVYAICILGHQLAGVTATGVLCGGVLLAGPLAAFGLFLVYASFFFYNFYLPESLWMEIGDRISPLWAYLVRTFHPVEQYAGQIKWGGAALGWLAAGLVIAALACWAYCRRPSEAAGKAISFRWPAAVLKYFAVLICTLGGGLLFRLIIGGLDWMVVGFCLGGLLSHCLVEIIYHLDFKKLFTHIRALGLFALLFAGGYLCLELDLMGYDAYLPRADQVQAVSVDLNWLGQDRDWRATDLELLDRQTYRQPETIEAALELCDMSRVMQGQDEYRSTVVRYTLKNGRQVYRKYSVPRRQASEQLMTLYSSQEYKENYLPLYRVDPADFQSAAFSPYRPSQQQQFLRQPGQAEELAQALRKDVDALQAQQIINKSPVCLITLSTDPDYGKEGRFDHESVEVTVPVYGSYENTLALLARQGIRVNEPLRPEEVEEAWLWVDQKEADEEDWPAGEAAAYHTWIDKGITQSRERGEVRLTDWQQIQPLLEKGALSYLAYWNPFFAQDETISLRVVLNENRGEQLEYVFPKTED